MTLISEEEKEVILDNQTIINQLSTHSIAEFAATITCEDPSKATKLLDELLYWRDRNGRI